MRFHRRLTGAVLTVFLLTGAIPFTAGCAAHRPATITTLAGQTAWTADQIVLRVNELQKATIQAEANGGIARNPSRTIVAFTVSADQILKTTPAGWRATLTASWADTKRRVPTVTTNAALAAAMGAVDLVLATVGGVQ